MESKKYSVISGFIFLMREMRSHTIRSFRLLPVGVFVKVLMPFAGIWLPNIVVRAITDKTGFGNLAAAVSVLGLVMVPSSMSRAFWRRKLPGSLRGSPTGCFIKNYIVTMRIWRIRRFPDFLTKRSDVCGTGNIPCSGRRDIWFCLAQAYSGLHFISPFSGSFPNCFFF